MADRPVYYYDLNAFCDINWSVPLSVIRCGAAIVPAQAEPRTSGINSGARFACMLNQTIPDYGEFFNNAPITNILFGQINQNPGDLENYLREQCALRGSDIRQVCSKTFDDIQIPTIDDALARKQPVIVLFANPKTLREEPMPIHYVNIVARSVVDAGYGDYIYMDTNGNLHGINKNRLKDLMDATNVITHNMGFMGKFNSIVCHNVVEYRDFAQPDFDAQYYLRQYPDLQKAFCHINDSYHNSSLFNTLFRHFIDNGIVEGRRANPDICFRSYLEENPEIKDFFRDNIRAAAAYCVAKKWALFALRLD